MGKSIHRWKGLFSDLFKNITLNSPRVNMEEFISLEVNILILW